MKQKHKDRLKPLEDLFIQANKLIYGPGTTYKEKLAHRTKLLKAAEKCNKTNCGFLMYDAAQYVRKELTREVLLAKEAAKLELKAERRKYRKS